MEIRHSRLVALLILFSLTLLSRQSVAKEEISTRNFVEQAAVKSLSVIESAENALESTDSQTVSAYAQKMIDEYRNVYSDILALANNKKIDMAKKSTTQKEAEEIALEERDNNTFDVNYARNQIAVHQHTISLFQRAAQSQDYDTRMLATATLPRLQQDLKMAEQLYAATAETKTDIYQDRENKIDYSNENEIYRTPSTDKTAP